MALWYQFNFIIKEVNNIDIILRHLSSEAIYKYFKKKFYLIFETDLRFKALAIYNIKIIAKFKSLIH